MGNLQELLWEFQTLCPVMSGSDQSGNATPNHDCNSGEDQCFFLVYIDILYSNLYLKMIVLLAKN